MFEYVSERISKYPILIVSFLNFTQSLSSSLKKGIKVIVIFTV